jgi:hypothetical protein
MHKLIVALVAMVSAVGYKNATAQDAISQAPAVEVPAVPGQETAVQEGNLEERVNRLEQQLARPAASTTEAVAVASNGERWRYRFHNGTWWYWLPTKRWMVWSSGQWVDYVPTTVTYVPSQSYVPSYGYGSSYSYPSGYSRYYSGYGGYSPFYGGYGGYGRGLGVGLYFGGGHHFGGHHSGGHHGGHHGGGHGGGHHGGGGHGGHH